ncbi:hypothetical protein LJC12_04820 [Odoribacter sp. OttesenSCG-928-J03]|nr:hypothetical protein [Odoribacter sp. OttesenSCG-928-J03]
MICCLFSSCEEDGPIYPDMQDNTFGFISTHVQEKITDSTTFITIHGKIDEERHKVFKEAIRIIPELTTAIDLEQYTLEENSAFFFAVDSLHSSVNIQVYPEHIYDTAQITVTTVDKILYKDYSIYIDTLIIQLIRVKQE